MLKAGTTANIGAELPPHRLIRLHARTLGDAVRTAPSTASTYVRSPSISLDSVQLESLRPRPGPSVRTAILARAHSIHAPEAALPGPSSTIPRLSSVPARASRPPHRRFPLHPFSRPGASALRAPAPLASIAPGGRLRCSLRASRGARSSSLRNAALSFATPARGAQPPHSSPVQCTRA